MPESRNLGVRGGQILALRFRKEASAEEVVSLLLEVVRSTDDVSLLKVFGDGDRVYPLEDRTPVERAWSWRVELYWGARAPWPMEEFLGRAEKLLHCVEGIRLEGGDRRARNQEIERAGGEKSRGSRSPAGTAT